MLLVVPAMLVCLGVPVSAPAMTLQSGGPAGAAVESRKAAAQGVHRVKKTSQFLRKRDGSRMWLSNGKVVDLTGVSVLDLGPGASRGPEKAGHRRIVEMTFVDGILKEGVIR